MKLEIVEEKILEYFSCNKANHSYKLIVLDKPFKKLYTGVTVDYIFKYVLKKRYSKTNVAAAILNLMNNEKLKCLFCYEVNRVVISSIDCPYWSYMIINHEFIMDQHGAYMQRLMMKGIEEITYMRDSYFNKFQSKAEMTLPLYH